MTPTKADKVFWDRLARKVGCIACRHDGIENNDVSIHHIAGRTRPGAHRQVLPLCAEHHQTGGMAAPAIHPWITRFEEKYGTQETLLAECHKILE